MKLNIWRRWQSYSSSVGSYGTVAELIEVFSVDIETAAKTLAAKLEGRPWFAHVLVSEIDPPGKPPGLVVFVKMDPPAEENLNVTTWEGYSVTYRHFGAIRA